MDMKKIYFTFSVLLLAVVAHAQPLNMEHMKGMQARNIGPGAMSGRVTAIDVDPNTGAIYAGTASGGLWRSKTGLSWEPIFDKAPVQAIGAVVVNPTNPDDIWVGTGEGNPRNSHNSGDGIFRSIDGGKNWKLMGLRGTRMIHRVRLHRDNPDVVWAASLGSAWGPSPERGVYKTTDGGKSWRKVLFVNDSVGCAELVVDPQNPNKLIASMWEFGRKPWVFNSGGKGSGMYVSFDGGETWERRTEKDGLPKGDLGRIGLAISPANPKIIYALVEAKENAIFKSNDGGFKWQKMASGDDIGSRPFYYAELYADPKNENRVYSIHSIITVSDDGGRTFKTFASWNTIHPDHHAYWIDPNNPSYIINGNDGGLNITRDRGQTWQFAANIPVGQFYHVNVDNDIPYNVYGGLQDNGSWVGPSAVWRWGGGIKNMDWQEVMFGDGFDVLPRRDDNRYGWAMSQGGELGYYDRLTGATINVKPASPTGERLRFNWNAGLAADPFADCGIFYGSQYLHRSTDCGKTWNIISPDLTTNDSAKIALGRSSGGLTSDVTSAENHCTIICIAPSPTDRKVIWVGTDDGNIQLTRDAGATWTNLSAKLTGLPRGSWIPQIEVTQNAGEAYVVANNYRRNDWNPYVYYTADYGATWRRIVDEKKVQGHAQCIIQDPTEPNLLFLGTDGGLFISLNRGDTWQRWSANDFPAVSVFDMKIQAREADLVIATFGRGMWILDDIRPLREFARTNGKLADQAFRLFPAPDAYLAEFRSVNGPRFAASGEFNGPNDYPSGSFTMWNKPPSPEADKKTEKKDDKASDKKDDKKPGGGDEEKKLKLIVLSQGGDTLRTLSEKIDTGIVTVGWWLDHKGVNFPRREAREPDADEPGGGPVPPGLYHIKVSYGDQNDSTDIHVFPDPRLEALSPAELAECRKIQTDYETSVSRVTEAADRLREAAKTINNVNTQLEQVTPDSLKKNLTKLGGTLLDSISTMQLALFGPKEPKGYIDDEQYLISAIYTGSGHLGNTYYLPGANSRQTVANSRAKMAAFVSRVNAFFDTQWPDYRKQIEAVQRPVFKDYQPIKIE